MLRTFKSYFVTRRLCKLFLYWPNDISNVLNFSTLVRYANRWLRRHPAVQLKAAETIELNGASAPDVKHTATSRHHAAKYQHSRFWALR